MTNGGEWLGKLAREMKEDSERGAAPSPLQTTARDLLTRFGYARRVTSVVNEIRNQMEKLGLRTVPDFEQAYIDATISIELDDDVDQSSRDSIDPTRRMKLLDASNRKPTAVKPDDLLEVATTIMLLNDFSQLPVMTGDRDVKGVISWKSIGMGASKSVPCEFVRECMDSTVREIAIDAPLFDAIENIAKYGYVLVRREDKVITGIVTTSDFANQFKQLAEPFLLVGEIEGHLRELVHGKFTIEEMREASNEKPVGGSADLTLGAYCRLLQQREHWERLDLGVDRKTFIERLDSVRKIRNDVMHFNPEGLDPEHLTELNNFCKFLSLLGTYG